MNALRNASCAGVASARGGSTGPTAFPCEPCIPRRDPQGPREAMKTSLAVTSTRQPDDPLLDVLAEVDVRLVHLEVDPGEDVDQALHLLPVRLAGHRTSRSTSPGSMRATMTHRTSPSDPHSMGRLYIHAPGGAIGIGPFPTRIRSFTGSAP